MILGPLKSSQAGNRLQAKHCVRSANVPASPHHQKPVESSPSRPPCSTLSLLPQTSTHQGSRGIPLLIPTHAMFTTVSPSPSRRIHTRKFSKLSEPPYLQPRGPSVVLCAALPHTRSSSYTTLVSVGSGSQQTEPDSLKAVPAQGSSWTHPQHPTQRKEKAAG